MIQLHASVSGSIKLSNNKSKDIKLGYLYVANRYILSLDKTTATIHFDEGIAENVQLDIFEVGEGQIENEQISISKKATDTTKSTK